MVFPFTLVSVVGFARLICKAFRKVTRLESRHRPGWAWIRWVEVGKNIRKYWVGLNEVRNFGAESLGCSVTLESFVVWYLVVVEESCLAL